MSIPTWLPTDNPWFAIVISKKPVWDVYTAFVAVLAVPLNIFAAPACVFIEPIPALSKRCSYAWSVIPIATVPRYPDPWTSVVPIPTPVIWPASFLTTVTAAPTRGAIPWPPVDPSETTTPPLGSWFKFTSDWLTILLPFADVIPVNTISVALADGELNP